MRPPPSSTEAGVSRGFVHLREGIESFLRFSRGKVWTEASPREKLHALSVAVRRPALDAMRESERRYRDQDAGSGCLTRATSCWHHEYRASYRGVSSAIFK